nr:TetR family transcriptional regulator C-terminal domain-containing protein [Shimazuella kribbensis]
MRNFLMDIVEEELNDEKGRGCMTANAALEHASQDEKVAEIVSQNLNYLEVALYGVFRSAQENDEIPSHKNARALARFVLNTVQGLRVLSKGCLGKNRRQILIDVVDVTIEAI